MKILGLLLHLNVRQVAGAFPGNSERSAKFWMDEQNFEGIGDICFSKLGSVACQMNEFDGVVDSNILHGLVRGWDDTVNA